MTDLRALLARTADHVAVYREAASEAAVFPEVDLDAVRVAIGGRLPDGPTPAGEVLDSWLPACSGHLSHAGAAPATVPWLSTCTHLACAFR